MGNDTSLLKDISGCIMSDTKITNLLVTDAKFHKNEAFIHLIPQSNFNNSTYFIKIKIKGQYRYFEIDILDKAPVQYTDKQGNHIIEYQHISDNAMLILRYDDNSNNMREIVYRFNTKIK